MADLGQSDSDDYLDARRAVQRAANAQMGVCQGCGKDLGDAKPWGLPSGLIVHANPRCLWLAARHG